MGIQDTSLLVPKDLGGILEIRATSSLVITKPISVEKPLRIIAKNIRIESEIKAPKIILTALNGTLDLSKAKIITGTGKLSIYAQKLLPFINHA